jgi:6-phosphogluconolactonase/glucosamine-6-phosphate isomerase/deaminase
MADAPALEVLTDGEAVAERGAALIAEWLRAQLATADCATVAVSGGHTPRRMFERLATRGLPWSRLALFQVDERFAPRGDPERNATQIAAAFATELRAEPHSFHWMPVEDTDAGAAARRYAAALEAAAGTPPALDVVHLGHLRMTLTLAALNAARHIVWLVAGADKRATLAALLAGEPHVVASRVRRSGAVVIADRAAADPPRRV